MPNEMTPDLTKIKDDLLNYDGCSAKAHAQLQPNLIEQIEYFRALNGQKSPDGSKSIFVHVNAHPDRSGDAVAATSDPHHYSTPYVQLRVGVRNNNHSMFGRLFASEQNLYSSALSLRTLKSIPSLALPQKCP